jgi:WD40 repeat protein
MTASRMLSLSLALGIILLQSGVQTGHTAAGADAPPDYVWTLALSQDGKRLATVSETKAILWDTATGKQLQSFQGHSAKHGSVALSADGKKVVTGSADKTAILWEADTGKKLQTFDTSWPVMSVALSADGKHLVTGSRDQPTFLWDTNTGKKLQTIGESNFLLGLSADGKHALTATHQGAHLWETATGKKLRTFHGHDVGINVLALSADGKKAFTVDCDPITLTYSVIVWEAASGKMLLTFPVLPPQQGRGKNSTWVLCMAVSVEGDQLITGCEDGTTALWDTATGKQVHNFQGHTRLVTSVALSADGKHAWSASCDGTTRQWDTKTGKELRSLGVPGAGQN